MTSPTTTTTTTNRLPMRQNHTVEKFLFIIKLNTLIFHIFADKKLSNEYDKPNNNYNNKPAVYSKPKSYEGGGGYGRKRLGIANSIKIKGIY
jgi:hypothetical protein